LKGSSRLGKLLQHPIFRNKVKPSKKVYNRKKDKEERE